MESYTEEMKTLLQAMELPKYTPFAPCIVLMKNITDSFPSTSLLTEVVRSNTLKEMNLMNLISSCIGIFTLLRL